MTHRFVMTRRFVLTGCLTMLLMTGVAAAQAPGGARATTPAPAASAPVAGDPVSGVWLDPGGSGAGLELKYDGRRAVTGKLLMAGRSPARNPAIRVGRFDRRTGALKLTGADTEADGAAPFVVQGTVKQDALTGTFTIGSAKGAFTFARQK